jgi:leucyl-tRNA synthetase
MPEQPGSAVATAGDAKSYDFRTIEKHWQDEWERSGLYVARDDDPREKRYVLEMLPIRSATRSRA